MEFKGTKGKWEKYKTYNEEDTPIFSVTSKDGNIAHVYNLQVCCGIQETTKANALLISKAPEMLEMLKDILEAQDCGETFESYKIEQLIKDATELK